VTEEFKDLLRAEMERVEASPRAGLVREAHQSHHRRQKAGRRAGVAVTGVAAVAAVATVVALQPGTGAVKGSPAQAAAPLTVNLGGVGAAVQTTSAPVTATLTAETGLSAASVLDEAAQAAQSGNVPLVGGWPAAPYWHTLTQYTDSSCGGQVQTSNTWLGKDGTEAAGTTETGPVSNDPGSPCAPVQKGYYPVSGVPAGIQLGGTIYSWARFAALPTDPAKLWPILEADATVGVAPSKGGLAWDYVTIELALADDPISPAMRTALFKVMEQIPGAKVTGKYTDSLGRTGTAISFSGPSVGSQTDVIDTSTGQILAQFSAEEPLPAGCVRASIGGSKGASCEVSGANTTVFISAGPAETMPLHVARFAMPNIVGDSLAQAQKTLTALGIESGKLAGEAATKPGQLPSGTVSAQSPAAGTQVTQETEPTLTLKR
jgi:hypothetical protein